MTIFNKFLKGSEWRKWDLHVHTPSSIFQQYGENNDATWESYITDLETLPSEFSVLGINDYFFLDGYERLIKERAKGRLDNLDCILPVVEFRIEKFAGIDFKQLKRINLHVIFSEEVSVETIKSQFLNTLEQSYYLEGSDQPWTRAITYESVKELGKTIKDGMPEDKRRNFPSDLDVGFSNLNVKEDKIFESLKKDCFTGKHLIAIGKTEWADLKWSDASIATKKSIINRANLVFTAASSVEEFEKAKLQLQAQFVNDLLLDCSDAHYLSTSSEKDRVGNCNTWIKADPNFEGLKQIIYEPYDRLKIQSFKPDVKKDRYLISELNFNDNGKLFGNQSILLNENLNAIIGGKSSGKSLLLYLIAKSIDPDQVERTSNRLKFDGYDFKEDFNFTVKWKNGEIDNFKDQLVENKLHKITYIPQLYINYLVEKNNKEELNILIRGILLQDEEFKVFYDEVTDRIKVINAEIDSLINSYIQIRIKALATQKESNELGKSTSIKKSIDDLQKLISDGQKSSNLSKEEFDHYTELSNSRQLTDKQINIEIKKAQVFEKVYSELESNRSELLGSVDADGLSSRGSLDKIFEELSEETDISIVRNKISGDYEVMLANLREEITKQNIEENLVKLRVTLATLNQNLSQYILKLAGQKELVRLTESLTKEKVKFDQAVVLEKQFKSHLEDYKNNREKTVKLLKLRYILYEEMISKVNATKKNIDDEITLEARLLYKQENFLFLDQVNKATTSQTSEYHKFFSGGDIDYKFVPEFYSNPLRLQDDKLFLDAERYISVKQKVSFENILRSLIKDSFEIDYTVNYKGDDLLKMSPGKKGTVLLILFLQISSSEYPILIDQPEDNLDNRTIYELLCRMIKEKKKERQIIIVSHNANLVVATDTENIIVANQEGQTTQDQIGRYRFEYVNGSLEHTRELDKDNKTILKNQGIKEHVCDILEGGNLAFKQRERKYALK
ncbi:TrlF family AAA-like ATPase [Pedobacter hartonius]|uniref:Uncharacterized protein n=1 Tax=Pedobacter hartonius TaxID=425514 RepID=A0A1H4HK16_9SPHI|nr:hypothetical protein [Pedobacter hartonius]SEB22217.1 hypothetical protein SAMN05443550_1292 [Pedobacter hartonius]